jgi:hypothetical protein
MKAKEAIEFLERKIKTLKFSLCWDSRDTKVMNEVIALLQQGEKYEAMWKCLTSEMMRILIMREHDCNYKINEKTDVENFSKLAISLKQKYFLKEKISKSEILYEGKDYEGGNE